MATARSSWRPPWLETQTAAAPGVDAAPGVVGRSTPLTTTGRPVRLAPASRRPAGRGRWPSRRPGESPYAGREVGARARPGRRRPRRRRRRRRTCVPTTGVSAVSTTARGPGGDGALSSGRHACRAVGGDVDLQPPGDPGRGDVREACDPALLETTMQGRRPRRAPGPSPPRPRGGPRAAAWWARSPNGGRSGVPSSDVPRCRPRSRRAAPAAGTGRARQAARRLAGGDAVAGALRGRSGSTGSGSSSRRRERPRAPSPNRVPVGSGQPTSTPARFFLPRRSTSQEPPSRSAVGRARASGSVDALVVEVGAALADRAPGLALALRPGRSSTSRSTTPAARRPADLGGAGLAQRGRQGRARRARGGRRRRTARPPRP